MAIDFSNVILDTMDTVYCKDITTGKLLAIMDELQDGTLENGLDKSYVTGTGGTRIATLYRNKTATFSCTNTYLSYSALALQTGTDAQYASEEAKIVVPTYEYIVVDNPTTVTLSQIPVGPTGAEVQYVYKTLKDGSPDFSKILEVDTTPSEGKFKIEASSKTLTFNEGDLKKGDTIFVTYDYEDSTGIKIVNEAKTFPKTCEVIIDCTGRDACDQSITYHVRIVMPNSSVDGAFTLNFGTDAATHPFSCEANATKCNNVSTLWECYVVE